MNVKEGDKIVFMYDDFLPLGLQRGGIYRCKGVRYCGGCEGASGVHVDIGITHGGKFTRCAICENIIDLDDVVSIPSTMFRVATPDECELYDDKIVQYSLNINT